MKLHMVAAMLTLALVAPANAFANSGSNVPASTLDKILQGHGMPGDTAMSTSNPDVLYRVTDSGTIVKVNSRFDTEEIVQPSWRLGMSVRMHESRR